MSITVLWVRRRRRCSITMPQPLLQAEALLYQLLRESVSVRFLVSLLRTACIPIWKRNSYNRWRNMGQILVCLLRTASCNPCSRMMLVSHDFFFLQFSFWLNTNTHTHTNWWCVERYMVEKKARDALHCPPLFSSPFSEFCCCLDRLPLVLFYFSGTLFVMYMHHIENARYVHTVQVLSGWICSIARRPAEG